LLRSRNMSAEPQQLVAWLSKLGNLDANGGTAASADSPGHWVFPRGWLDAATLRALHRRQIIRPLVQLTANLTVYGACAFGAVAIGRWYVWPIAWLLMAWVLTGMIAAVHECAHRMLWRGPRLNRWTGAVLAAIGLYNFTVYQGFHLTHHKYTAGENDPEGVNMITTLRIYIMAVLWPYFFIYMWRCCWDVGRGNFPVFVKNERSRRDARRDNWVVATWFGLVITATAVWPIQMLAFYLVPVAIYFPMFFLHAIAEHQGCDLNDDVARNTRCILANPFARMILWSSNYHAEHHAFPGIPSYRLRQTHVLIGDRFAVRSSYAAFHVKLIAALWKKSRVTKG